MANDRPMHPEAGTRDGIEHRNRTPHGRATSGRGGQARGSRDNSFIERQLRQKKRARIWRAFAVCSFLLLVAGIGYATLTQHGRDTVNTIGDVGSMAITAKTNPDLIFKHAGSDNVNILLIGRDVNYKMSEVYDPKTKQMRPFHVYDEDASARSDTMIVVTLDRRRNTIRMVSFPRDAIVRLPPNSEGIRRAKLNAAHAYGGPELLMQTMHDELGLTIHHYAVIRFEGFKKLIDQVGGIEVDVLGALHRDGTRGPLKYDDDWGNLHINLQPGKQWLNGENAHNYVRFRMDTEGDPGRIRRQQGVMRALAKRIMQQPFYKIPALVEEVRRQFKTDLTEEEIASGAAFAHGIGDASKIQPITLYGTYGRRGSLILNEPKNKQLLAYIFGSTFNADRFLHRSPSTRKSDVGGDDTDNPEVQSLLREAGLLDGDLPQLDTSRRASNDVAESRSKSRYELEVEAPRAYVSRDYDLPDLSPESRSTESRASTRSSSQRETIIPDLSVEAPSSPTRIMRERARSSEPAGETEKSTPSRRLRRTETSQDTQSTPSRRERTETSLDDTVSSPVPVREAPPARRDLDVETPLSVEENASSSSD